MSEFEKAMMERAIYPPFARMPWVPVDHAVRIHEAALAAEREELLKVATVYRRIIEQGASVTAWERGHAKALADDAFDRLLARTEPPA